MKSYTHAWTLLCYIFYCISQGASDSETANIHFIIMCKVFQAQRFCEKINKNKTRKKKHKFCENWKYERKSVGSFITGGREMAGSVRAREWQRHLMHDDSSRVIMTTTTTAMEQTTLQDPETRAQGWKLKAGRRWSARGR